MDIQNITQYFTRSQKLILGVCSTIAQKYKLPPVGIRIALIVLTLIFIPLGIIVYLGAYLSFNQRKGRMVTFGLLGALLGIPLSYYFQSDMVQNYGSLYGNTGMFSYLKNFTTIVDEYDKYVGNGWDIVFNVLLSIVVFALVGGAIGYFMDKNEKNNHQPN